MKNRSHLRPLFSRWSLSWLAQHPWPRWSNAYWLSARLRPNGPTSKYATNSAGIGTRPGSTWMPGRSCPCVWSCMALVFASSYPAWRSNTALCCLSRTSAASPSSTRNLQTSPCWTLPVSLCRPAPSPSSIQRTSFLGPYTYEAAAWEIAPWLKSLKARDGDSLLVTIEDWEAGRYRLEHESAGRRRFDEVDRKNRELADLLFGALEDASSQSIFGREAVAKAYAAHGRSAWLPRRSLDHGGRA